MVWLWGSYGVAVGQLWGSDGVAVGQPHSDVGPGAVGRNTTDTKAASPDFITVPQSSAMGRRYGAAPWGGAMGQRRGVELWGRVMGQRRGAAL